MESARVIATLARTVRDVGVAEGLAQPEFRPLISGNDVTTLLKIHETRRAIMRDLRQLTIAALLGWAVQSPTYAQQPQPAAAVPERPV